MVAVLLAIPPSREQQSPPVLPKVGRVGVSGEAIAESVLAAFRPRRSHRSQMEDEGVSVRLEGVVPAGSPGVQNDRCGLSLFRPGASYGRRTPRPANSVCFCERVSLFGALLARLDVGCDHDGARCCNSAAESGGQVLR